MASTRSPQLFPAAPALSISSRVVDFFLTENVCWSELEACPVRGEAPVWEGVGGGSREDIRGRDL
jgi:hypothetical protein